MNEVDRLFKAHENQPVRYVTGYLSYLVQVLQKLDTDAIAKVIQLFMTARETKKHIFFIGNGGSAATASHFANDIAIGTRSGSHPFKAISLTDNVAISASGNSKNLIKAVELANARGNHTIGITGFDGGQLKKICKSGIHVPSNKGEYGPVEDVHMVLDHIIGNYLLRLIHPPKG